MMTLYLDMDGVVADFDRGYKERFGIEASKVLDNVDWQLVRDTPNFYRDLPLISDAWDLVSGIMNLGFKVESNEVKFLTGVPDNVPEALGNKLDFIWRHFPGFEMIGCRSRDKSRHCKAGDILIDDWEKHRTAWERVGGRWITHTSAESSLSKLRDLLIARA